MTTETRVLYIGSVWPETNASAAGLRNWSFVKVFRSWGWKVLYASDAKDNPFKDALHQLGTETAAIQSNDPAFDQLAKEYDPHYVIFDRFIAEEKFSWRIRKSCPNAIRVLDTSDLHFLRRERQKHFYPKENIEGERERELASIFRSDLTLLVSDYEERFLTDLGVPRALVRRCSLFYKDAPSATPSFSERNHFVFIGNFRHAPNVDGVLWLRDEIWPLLHREYPEAEMHIYGAYPGKQHMDLSQARIGFKVLGPLADQYEGLQKYRVSLAPLRFGAGVKGKILDSWWCGTPVVSTRIGAEGMGEREAEWGGLISDGPQEFATAAIQLYQNEMHWLTSQKIGRHILHKYFDEEKQSEQLKERLVSTRTDILGHRARNIVGALLWHHAHQSTHYFSKWIESKRQLVPKLHT